MTEEYEIAFQRARVEYLKQLADAAYLDYSEAEHDRFTLPYSAPRWMHDQALKRVREMCDRMNAAFARWSMAGDELRKLERGSK